VILVDDVAGDPQLAAPQPYQILRSTLGSQFVLGGFQSVTITITVIGPVQQASNREIQMLPEADRVGSIRSFWCLQPIFLTRGYDAVPGVDGQTPVGAVPGTVYVLADAPQGNAGALTRNGLMMIPGVDYVLAGSTITLFNATVAGDVLYFTSPETVNVQPEASDILVYPPNGEQFRVLSRYFDPGSGYWKALGTRMAAA
jgi:hypothetical protein